MNLIGRLRRNASIARVRPKSILRRKNLEESSASKTDAHDVEIFSEDFKFLRALLILLFFAFVFYIGKAIDRWGAATVIHNHLESTFYDAARKARLQKSTQVAMHFKPQPGEYFGRVQLYDLEPLPEVQAELIVDAAAQAIQALRNKNLNIDYAQLSLGDSNDGATKVNVRVEPITAALESLIDFWNPVNVKQRASVAKWTEDEHKRNQEDAESWKLIRERCPEKVGNSILREREEEGAPKVKRNGIRLKMNAPQAIITLSDYSVPIAPNDRHYTAPKFKILLFRYPDENALTQPIQCATAFAPAMAIWAEPNEPEITTHSGGFSSDASKILHAKATAEEIAAARKELESSHLQFFDVLQINFSSLLFLFPGALLILSGICASVLRRIAQSLPQGVSVGDVLLNIDEYPGRQLTAIDGLLLKATEKFVRFWLLTVSIFCPVFVILTVPVVADAEFSYEQASQPVLFLFKQAQTFPGWLWLIPLSMALLLALHQWALIMSGTYGSRNRVPITHTFQFRWVLGILVGIPSSIILVGIGGYVAYKSSANIWQALFASKGEESSRAPVIENAFLIGLGLAMVFVSVAIWTWSVRSKWLDTRQGDRSVVRWCLMGIVAILITSSSALLGNSKVDGWEAGCVVAGIFILWLLVIHLRPKLRRPWKVGL